MNHRLREKRDRDGRVKEERETRVGDKEREKKNRKKDRDGREREIERER